jgi:hypothetical protein
MNEELQAYEHAEQLFRAALTHFDAERRELRAQQQRFDSARMKMEQAWEDFSQVIEEQREAKLY